MLEISERAACGDTDLTLTLPFEARQRSRLRVRLSSGEEAALLLPRGSVLRGGDLLTLSDGRIVRVVAAPESVSTVRSHDARLLARVAYHLGNRHVALEVGEGLVRYLHDHVLDDMVRELGLSPLCETSPFEPEGGAYGGQRGHEHAHSHGHSHAPEHGHDHAHAHHHPSSGYAHPELPSYEHGSSRADDSGSEVQHLAHAPEHGRNLRKPHGP